MKPLLEIDDLSVDFQTASGSLNAINKISLHIGTGEIVCLVGESGSGKTITSLSIMHLINYDGGYISHGDIKLDGQSLVGLSQKEISDLRGKKIAMIFQEPMTALDPIFTIGSQIIEVIVRHERISKLGAKEKAISLLRRVGIPEPEIRMGQYPYELSGGMRQRVMIAMALACGPELLIADEPTTALDVTIQAQILSLLRELKDEFQMSILLITHDLGIAAEMADRVVVMYAGKVVEQSPVHQLFENPAHPYTQGLLHSIVTLDNVRGLKLYTIKGTIPSLSNLPTGCRFHPRCPYATDRCLSEDPPLQELHGREVACWNAERIDHLAAEFFGDTGTTAPVELLGSEGLRDDAGALHSEQPLLQVKNVKKYFPIRQGWFGRGRASIKAVDDVSFDIRKGETFGLVGESGCGKSTLGRVLLQLEKATAGSIHFEGRDLIQSGSQGWKETRRDMQIVFQDPYGSINPRWKVGDIIGEPFWVHESLRGAAKRAKVESVMELVGLNPSWYDRLPHEFSGGQRQRIGIARAIALNPKFILADEAVSALDVSVQSQIVNLMQDIQQRMNLTYLFIAHGLNIVRYISDRIGVMYLGKLVEIAPTDELFRHPAHHYTKALLSAIPVPDPKRKRSFVPLEGEMPSPARPPTGCRFHTRCPAATALCREVVPELAPIAPGHYAACHYPL
ncbi:glutathione ABC transporter ATP-binding protein [Paenibacillus sp. Soil766]|uniref:ABC transporter ATP-binding protein n=1 Tax=Paenibacillus sp. Soil766 TaxID=1736404 RepID=UPI00070A44E7|nr:ABC transporter ATP-binding protein [Paenibacillus sp. Soil766]KRF06004.1 glutathione ABC transporter ATP-binding protein [Paenibacillus sp. Soil766]